MRKNATGALHVLSDAMPTVFEREAEGATPPPTGARYRRRRGSLDVEAGGRSRPVPSGSAILDRMALRQSDAEGLKNTLEGGQVNVVEVDANEVRLWLDSMDTITLRVVQNAYGDPDLSPELEIWIDHHLDR